MNKHSWTYKKLGEVCEVERGGSPRPIQQYITDSEDGVNWIKIGDAQEGSKYITSTKEKIIPEGVKKSRLVHCGDFMLNHKVDTNAYLRYMKKLTGNILLIRGNHDYISLCTEPQENLIAVVDKAFIMADGVKIYGEHYPCCAFNGDFQVFGHIHTLSDGTCYGIDGDVPSRLRKNQYDVGVDQNGYRPISYWELCDIFRNKACDKIK
jgi:calcineurin-like phosphoesterase family protein